MQQALELADQAQAPRQVPIRRLLVKDGVLLDTQPTIYGEATQATAAWPLRAANQALGAWRLKGLYSL